MRDFIAYMQTDWRLLIRGPYIWILLVLATGHTGFVLSTVSWITNIGYLMNQFVFLFLAPFSIMALFSGVHGARRDYTLGVDKIMNSIPYHTGKQLMARYVATSSPFIIIAFIPTILWIILSINASSLPVKFTYVIMLLSSSIIAFSYIIAVGWLIGSWIRSRLSYFISFVVWMICIYGGLFASQLLPVSVDGISNFLLIDYKSLGYVDDLWGFSSDSTFWLHRAFYSFLLLTLLLSMIYVMSKARKEPLQKGLYRIGISAALVLSIYSLYLYADLRSERANAFYAQVEFLTEEKQLKSNMNSEIPLEEEMLFDIETYDLFMTYLENKHLQIHSKISIRSLANEKTKVLKFTLKEAFQVERVEVGGQIVDYIRDKDILKIQFPEGIEINDLVEVNIFYTGQVEEWRVVHPYGGDGKMLATVYFATDQELFLPGSLGWYPLLGDVKLQIVSENRRGNIVLEDQYITSGTADYTLTVDYPNTIKLFSNLEMVDRKEMQGRQIVVFEEKDVEDFSLLGGPLVEVMYEADGLKVKAIISELMDKELTYSIVQNYHQSILELFRVLQLPQKHNVITIVPQDSAKGQRVSSKNLGGMYQGSGFYLFNGLYTGEEMTSRVIGELFYLELIYPSMPMSSSKEFFQDAMISYIQYQTIQSPIYLTRHLNETPFYNNQEKRDKNPHARLEKYMNSHTDEEIESMLRRMYERILEDPTTNVDLDILLSK